MIYFYEYLKIDSSHQNETRRREWNLDGNLRSAEVERMLAQDVLETKELDVRLERHLAQAISVEVELILDDLRKVLQLKADNAKRSLLINEFCDNRQ